MKHGILSFPLRCVLSDIDVDKLCEFIKNSEFIYELKLSNELSPKSVEKIAEALKVNSSMVKLDLTNNHIKVKGAEALAKSLEVESSSIDWFCLSDNRIGNIGAKAFSELIKTNSKLVCLQLSFNGISKTGKKDLADAMESNITIVRLDV